MPSPAPGGAANARCGASHAIERRSSTDASACSPRSAVSFPPPTTHRYRPRNTHDAWPARAPGPALLECECTPEDSVCKIPSGPSAPSAGVAYASKARTVHRPVATSSAYASSKHAPDAPAPPKTSRVARAESARGPGPDSAERFLLTNASSSSSSRVSRVSPVSPVSSNASLRAHMAAATCSARGAGARGSSGVFPPTAPKNKPPKNPAGADSPSYAVRHVSARMSRTRASLRNRRLSSSPPNTTSVSVPGTTVAVCPRRLRGLRVPAAAVAFSATKVAVSDPVDASVEKSIRETSRNASSSSSSSSSSSGFSTSPPTR